MWQIEARAGVVERSSLPRPSLIKSGVQKILVLEGHFTGHPCAPQGALASTKDLEAVSLLSEWSFEVLGEERRELGCAADQPLISQWSPLAESFEAPEADLDGCLFKVSSLLHAIHTFHPED